MPILEPVRDAANDLAQGDLLKDVSLYGGDAGGEAFRLPETFAVVVSRDCAALHDRHIVVAPVRQFVAAPPGTIEVKELADFFAAVRDGVATPDRMYLGSLQDDAAAPRYQALLDRLALLRLPKEADRPAWLREHRVARLTPDFVRALPVRLFQSAARVGYDDYQWYSTQDLRWLIVQVEAELAKRAAEIAAKKSELATAQATDPHNRGRLTTSETQLRKAQEAREKLAASLEPYSAELRQRGGG